MYIVFEVIISVSIWANGLLGNGTKYNVKVYNYHYHCDIVLLILYNIR